MGFLLGTYKPFGWKFKWKIKLKETRIKLIPISKEELFLDKYNGNIEIYANHCLEYPGLLK